MKQRIFITLMLGLMVGQVQAEETVKSNSPANPNASASSFITNSQSSAQIAPSASSSSLTTSNQSIIPKDNQGILNTMQDKASYSIGLDVGTNIKTGFKAQNIKVDPMLFAKGIEDAMANNPPLLSPEQVRSALMEFQNEMLAQAQQKAQTVLNNQHASLVNAPISPVEGNINGNTTLIEFFDYQCVYCRQMASLIEQLKKSDPQLRIVYKEFPILGQNSEFAARAALAAQKQGKFAQLHEALMVSSKPLTQAQVLELAKGVGLNIDTLQKDANDPQITQELQNNVSLAKSLGLVATPAFIITATQLNANGAKTSATLIPGTSDLQRLEKAIAKAQNVQNKNNQIVFPTTNQQPSTPAGVWEGI